jgi:hypothetical protein
VFYTKVTSDLIEIIYSSSWRHLWLRRGDLTACKIETLRR